MHLEVTPEVIVSQLEIGKTESSIAQATKAIKNTKDFEKFSKHIISLNDKLKHMHGFVSLSNSEPYFKIKCDSTTDSKEIIEEFTAEVKHWSNKYDVKLQKVENKDVYYIIGKN
ncbi:MAG: hypothetical protein U9Q20_07840 [Campylobacterota bacterium]|nr:hypothetical protein [Campylobacterota bacterium]